ncbi:MAG: MBL fold metallo-hydrolase [Bacteroidota bacterium]
MDVSLVFLGGTDEIGANSIYAKIGSTGFILDSGLHPNKRDKEALPAFEFIENEQTDYLLISHSHTDHTGAIPYALKLFPHLKLFSTYPTRDILPLMIKDTARILRTDLVNEFSADMLSLYSSEMLEKIPLVNRGIKYRKSIKADEVGTSFKFYPAGHVLGAASILLEGLGKRIFYTGDYNLSNSALIKGAKPPGGPFDVLITEITNFAPGELPPRKDELKRLAAFINRVADSNGSVLLPAFSLGKTQELLKICHDMMVSGKIPHLPVYSAGLGQKISRVYDIYCYEEEMLRQGFEISDIRQHRIDRENISRNKFFKEASLVIVSNGMLVKNTLSYNLALEWMRLPNYGIAITGYMDPDSPGAALANSEKNVKFEFGGKKVFRGCELGVYRLSSHSYPDDMINFFLESNPAKILLFTEMVIHFLTSWKYCRIEDSAAILSGRFLTKNI